MRVRTIPQPAGHAFGRREGFQRQRTYELVAIHRHMRDSDDCGDGRVCRAAMADARGGVLQPDRHHEGTAVA